jgi:DNA-binding response OmpR family regulator
MPLESEPKKHHVLLVDDSSTIRIDLRAAFQEAGFSVTACNSKASAEKALRERPFDLYIFDVLLGDGSGVDLLRDMRLMPGLADVPVLLLSSEADVQNRVRGLRVGADDFIGKPYSRAYVVRRAMELLRAARGDAPPSSLSPACKKILIVDDSPIYAARLASVLREEGHDLIVAASGEEALQLLAEDHVDVIVMDLHMPGLSGVETIRRIRAMSSGATVPILVLTAAADHDKMRAECVAVGADDVATKSPELGLIKVRLRGLFRSKRRPSDSGEVEKPSSVRYRNTPPPPSSNDRRRASLLNRVIIATGIPPGVSSGAVARACARVGVNAGTMSPADLKKALPALRHMIRLFASPEQIERRMAAIEALASGEEES